MTETAEWSEDSDEACDGVINTEFDEVEEDKKDIGFGRSLELSI